jgi:hypothetical protein
LYRDPNQYLKLKLPVSADPYPYPYHYHKRFRSPPMTFQNPEFVQEFEGLVRKEGRGEGRK